MNRTKLEIFNESMIMVIQYHLLVFSKFNLDNTSKYQMGYSYVGVIGVTLVVNILNALIKSINAKARNT